LPISVRATWGGQRRQAAKAMIFLIFFNHPAGNPVVSHRVV